MAARDFQALAARRADRARELAGRYPAARDALLFLAGVAEWQADVDPTRPLDALPGLLALVRQSGPDSLIAAAGALDAESCREAMETYQIEGARGAVEDFFARVLLQPVRFGAPMREIERLTECPSCKHPPQFGLLKPLSHGQALWLSCSLCFREWKYPRGRCIGCGQTDAKATAYYRAEQLPHLQVMTCDDCRQYIHLIDLEAEPLAVGDIDEVAALPLDLWAVERGFAKIQPNLVGI
ncbi:MAG: formate dehydrogenase accessory protein FdhE [Bryobacterales bacterium]